MKSIIRALRRDKLNSPFSRLFLFPFQRNKKKRSLTVNHLFSFFLQLIFLKKKAYFHSFIIIKFWLWPDFFRRRNKRGGGKERRKGYLWYGTGYYSIKNNFICIDWFPFWKILVQGKYLWVNYVCLVFTDVFWYA